MINKDKILVLAFALEYDCTDEVQNKVNDILAEIEHEINIDTYVGNRLFEYGKVMGWLREGN